MKQTVKLFISNGSWCVDWQGTTEADSIQELFGTTQLPTPYLETMPGQGVALRLAQIPANKNYTFEVTL